MRTRRSAAESLIVESESGTRAAFERNAALVLVGVLHVAARQAVSQTGTWIDKIAQAHLARGLYP